MNRGDLKPRNRVVEALLDALALKDVARAGWRRVGVEAPEAVASHTWGVALLALVLAPPELNRARVVEYALVHDLAEVLTGDITPHDGVPRAVKRAREAEAMRAICEDLPHGAELFACWRRYEARADAEARFVAELDRLDMALQAAAYVRRGALGAADARQFLDSAAHAVTTPTLVRILDAVRCTVEGSG